MSHAPSRNCWRESVGQRASPSLRVRFRSSRERSLGAVVERAWSTTGREGEPPMTRFLAEQLSTAHWFDQTSHPRSAAVELLLSRWPRDSERLARADWRGERVAALRWQNGRPGRVGRAAECIRLESGET